MSEEVVTSLVIDADTSGADRYSQAMDGAAQASTNVLKSIATAGLGIGAALGSLRVFIDQIGGINKQFLEVGEGARNASMSIREFQETLYAAKTRGLSDKDFVSGLDKIGADIIAASRGITDFGKLFEANGVSIRNANGELKTTKEALGDIANLMKNAGNPQVEQAIAKIVGLSKDWIPFLRDGTDEIERTKAAAANLGIIVDNDVIAKATDFDRQWKAAVAAWDLQFKASLAEVLPLLIQAAGYAKTILDAAGKAASFVQSSVVPIEDQSVENIEKQIKAVEALRGKMTDLKEAQDALTWATTQAVNEFSLLERARLANQNLKNEIQLRNQKSMLLGDDQADMQAADDMLEKLKLLVFWKKQLVDLPSVDGINPAAFGDRQTKLPVDDTKSNAFDRSIEQVTKHTARMQADTAAVGLGVGTQAEFRAQAQLTAAALASGAKDTEELRDKISGLAKTAGEAATALEKAKFASQIEFDRGTAFLSPTDLRIAQQLKGIYGNDIPTALASTEAAALRANEVLRQLNDVGRDTVKGFVSDFSNSIRNGASAWDAFQSAGLNALNKIADKLTSMAIDNLWGSAFGGSGSGGILGLLGLGGGSGASSGFAMSSGLGAGTGGLSFPMFAEGTNFAPGGPAIVGEKGIEIVNLPRGSSVTPNNQLSKLLGANDNAPISIVYAPTIHAPNSDPKAIAQLASVVAKDKRDFERNVTGVMAKYRSNTPGSNR
ncbi:hypothetical protein HNQ36_003051 [Afipia massiliensis]|uniref:Bacteriophage tail tape measure C-terminal domain-containing protein n=1 Tax=Afipia massiliensis TaxID=211460 RepID=A0A840N1X1_9BRAD|nr:hypothetical protein [Afipia massiliensis]MBB5053060.1 hypothetical protein [Afipia massiliensis]